MAVKPLPGAQLDRTHPLAQGLVGCWLMNEGGGDRVYDYSGNDNHGTFVGGPTWAVGADGAAVHISANGQRIQTASSAVSRSLSVVMRVRYDGGLLKGLYGIGALSDAWGTLDIRVHNPSYIIAVGVSGTTVLAAGYYTIAFVGLAGQVARVYINGMLDGEAAFGGFSTTAYPRHIGAYYGPNYEWNGLIGASAEYDRALTADEVAWLHAEPYCMFARPDRWLRVFDFGATVGGTGAVYRPWLMTGGRMR